MANPSEIGARENQTHGNQHARFEPENEHSCGLQANCRADELGSSVTYHVRLPRRRSPFSYSRQLVAQGRSFGTWRRPAVLCLLGIRDGALRRGDPSYRAAASMHQRPAAFQIPTISITFSFAR